MNEAKKYPDGLRTQAVQLVFDEKGEGESLNAVGRRIGERLSVNPSTLRTWVRQNAILADEVRIIGHQSGFAGRPSR